MKPKIFIDGEHGTTGLQIRALLADRGDLEIISIPTERRKEAAARAEFLNAADVAILCLPDAAAEESVSLITNDTTKVIDASTAHRVAEGWEYGFAEMDKDQAGRIAGAKRIANPGCWPQGPIATLRPLVSAGLLPADFPVTVNGISGYSGGGRPMIEDYVGNFAQGMITVVPLQLGGLDRVPTGAELHAAIADHYASIDGGVVEVAPYTHMERVPEIDPEIFNGTNRMKVYVFANDKRAQALLLAVYDNLGKGASGAAVQNLDLTLGIKH